MKKLILTLSLFSILSLSSCTVTKTIIEVPEENSKEVVETNNSNEDTNDLPSNSEDKNSKLIEYYTNNKTDGTIHYFIHGSEYDEFKIIEDKIDDIENVSLKEVLEKEVELSSDIPEGTVINDVKVENNIAYVDVNSLFSEDPNTNSSYASRFKVYSIVNTLYYNRVFGIDGVVFLIDGKESPTISIFTNDIPFKGATFSVNDNENNRP